MNERLAKGQARYLLIISGYRCRCCVISAGWGCGLKGLQYEGGEMEIWFEFWTVGNGRNDRTTAQKRWISRNEKLNIIW